MEETIYGCRVLWELRVRDPRLPDYVISQNAHRLIKLINLIGPGIPRSGEAVQDLF